MADEFPLQTDYNEPILFRTTGVDVYRSTLDSGSLWLRSDEYYRNIEDKARVDGGEGVNSSLTTIPLRISRTGLTPFELGGGGKVGVQIVPHYIASFHGTSISVKQLSEFGGHTFGVVSLSRLATEVLFQVSKQLGARRYRFGPVSYQRTSLALLLGNSGGAIGLSDTPPVALSSINTDILRKEPVLPFIEQDEWRIVIFTDGYLDGDPNAPLKINVDPGHFFPYQTP